jgi:hypothetical protein
VTLQDYLEKRPDQKRLMTRSDFVGMYRVAHDTLKKHIQNGNIEIHLIGTTIHIDADEALAATGNPPLRHSSRINDLFS